MAVWVDGILMTGQVRVIGEGTGAYVAGYGVRAVQVPWTGEGNPFDLGLA